MCGISGWLGRSPTPQSWQSFRSLVGALRHRGPDDEGLLAANVPPNFALGAPHVDTMGDAAYAADLPTVFFGSTRLAILDRSRAGHQPMVSDDRHTGIVFNGEIYNYIELRQELRDRGHQFRSGTDTEVLLHAYLEWGRGCLDRLIGMFAFAVLDERSQRLFAARDHLGVKPLYYVLHGGNIMFASEIAPLLDWAGQPRKASDRSTYRYLDHGYVDVGSSTIFRDVLALPAGCFLDIDLRSLTVADPVRYWEPDRSQTVEMSRAEAAARLRDLFLESVELQLRSDVPVGALLSGGMDSSSVVMAMREVGGSSLDIHTFSYIGTDGAPSEEQWIDTVNRAAGATSHKLSLTAQEFMADLPALAERQDEPFGSAAVYAQSRLFHLAAEAGVPVVLSGQGGDEMLGGYPDFWAAWVASLLRRGAVGGAAQFLARVGRRYPPAWATRKSVARTALVRAAPAWVRSAVTGFRPTKPWIDPAWVRRTNVGAGAVEATGRHALRERLWFRLNAGFGDLLRFEDRNSMTWSVEARVPFVSRPLIEFALTVPEFYVLGPNGEPKSLFRDAMRGIVPDPVLDRTDRIGFAVPLERWPAVLPSFGELLDSAASVPAVRSETVESFKAALTCGSDVPSAAVFPLWRIAGLGAWNRRFAPDWS